MAFEWIPNFELTNSTMYLFDHYGHLNTPYFLIIRIGSI